LALRRGIHALFVGSARRILAALLHHLFVTTLAGLHFAASGTTGGLGGRRRALNGAATLLSAAFLRLSGESQRERG